MKKIFALLLLSALSFPAVAQKFDWNINFDYNFSNYEYDRSSEIFEDSYTLHAARITPEAGVLIKQSPSVFHRVRAGVDIFKQMGEGLSIPNLFKELVFYYDVEAAFRNGGRFEALAGSFPRRYSDGDYNWLLFDDDNLFFDNNIEGILLKYHNRHIFAELGLDWPGMLGDDSHPVRRERFQVFSAGLWNFAGPFSLGWIGSFYHFACSPFSPNVVDNHMLNTSLEWTPFSMMDDLKITAEGVFTYQCDRHHGMDLRFPMGFLSRQMVAKWGVVIDNRFYFGDDLMPFFDTAYSGLSYGKDLYMADLSFHTRLDHPGWSDFVSLKYEPKIADFLNLSVSLSFFFGEPPSASCPVFRGWQQSIALRANLDALRPRPKAPKSSRGTYFHEFKL